MQSGSIIIYQPENMWFGGYSPHQPPFGVRSSCLVWSSGLAVFYLAGWSGLVVELLVRMASLKLLEIAFDHLEALVSSKVERGVPFEPQNRGTPRNGRLPVGFS